jgi:hypothetical protein
MKFTLVCGLKKFPYDLNPKNTIETVIGYHNDNNNFKLTCPKLNTKYLKGDQTLTECGVKEGDEIYCTHIFSHSKDYYYTYALKK